MAEFKERPTEREVIQVSAHEEIHVVRSPMAPNQSHHWSDQELIELVYV